MDDELLGEFIGEAQDILTRLREVIDNYGQSSIPIKEQLAEISRGIHTIKGGSSMFPMGELTEKAHKLESFLAQFKEKPENLKKHLSSIVKFLDFMENSLESFFLPSKSMENSNSHQEKESHENKLSVHQDIVRVPLDRIQKNIDAITEIFLIKNQMSLLVDSMLRKKLNISGFLEDWDSLDNAMKKNIGELERVAMGMRMMPVKNLFQRMEKTVRSYEETSGKSIHVEILGEETELDKKILDYLGEPLIHLIRNAMDHGIESHEERVQKGKKAQGTITLISEVKSNEVVITIRDDGKGIYTEKVKEAAKKKGFDVSQVQTKEQAINLIFLPGFSTSDQVTEISGRGVGMDAVKTFVESLGGSVEIFTEEEKGTDFVLHLPLGMSLIPAIIVLVHHQIYAVSSSEILEIFKISYKEILKNGNNYYIVYKNNPIPCFVLEDFFQKNIDDPNNLYLKKDKLSICITKNQNQFVAFCVEEFLENTEIATKILAPMAPQIPYIVGTSILATGDPVFVISMRKFHQWILETQGQNHV